MLLAPAGANLSATGGAERVVQEIQMVEVVDLKSQVPTATVPVVEVAEQGSEVPMEEMVEMEQSLGVRQQL